MATKPSASPEPGGHDAVLGASLTVVLVAAYFGFIGLGAFAPGLLAKPVTHDGTVTWAFAYGLFVMGLGVALTGLYVLAANRAETRGRRAR